jgi:hypothetical protein
MAYYRDFSQKNDQASDQFLEIFAEFDFSCFDEKCNFLCHECRNMLKCAMYNDFKDEWKSFYT